MADAANPTDKNDPEFADFLKHRMVGLGMKPSPTVLGDKLPRKPGQRDRTPHHRAWRYLRGETPQNEELKEQLAKALDYPDFRSLEAAYHSYRLNKRNRDTSKDGIFEPDKTGYWTFRTTELLDGKWKVGLPLLGESQRGRSYEAKDESGRTKVFVKTLKIKHQARGDEIKEQIDSFNRRFSRERENLRHLAAIEEGVAKFIKKQIGLLIDINGEPHDVPYIIQSWVEGVSLRKAQFKDRRTGRREVAICLRLARQLLERFADVHQRGLVHADVRPENVMISGAGADRTVTIVDFGESFFIRKGSPLLTASGERTKQDPYQAPEQRDNATITSETSADRYGIGGCLYFIATGFDPPYELPKSRENLKREIFRLLETHNPELLAENLGYGDAVALCMHHDPKDRPAHTEDLQRLLEAFEIGAGRASRSPTEIVDNSRTKLRRALSSIASNPLFERLLAYDIEMLARKADVMVNVGRAEITGTRDEVILTLLHYLAELKEGDSYTTMTKPGFWWEENLAPDGRFLHLNQFLAARKVKTERLFLIAPSDLDLFPVEKILEAHKKTVFNMRELHRKNFVVRYKAIREPKPDAEVGEGLNVGVIERRDGSAVTLSFHMDRMKLIRRVHVRQITEGAPLDELRTHLQTVRQRLAKAKPIETLDMVALVKELADLKQSQ
jgi:serine/threonine protein kinase